MTKTTRTPEKTIPAEAKDIVTFAAMKMALDASLEAWEDNPTTETHQAYLELAVRAYRDGDPELFDAEGVTALLAGFAQDDEPDPVAFLIREFGRPAARSGNSPFAPRVDLPWDSRADKPATVKRTPEGPEQGHYDRPQPRQTREFPRLNARHPGSGSPR